MRRLLLLAAVAALALLSACSGGPISALDGSPETPHLDLRSYAGAELERLAVAQTLEVGGPAAGVVAADVLGDADAEFVVLDGTQIRVFSAPGEPVAEFPLPEGSFHLSLAADADGDGKAELVLGAENDGAARFLIVKGDGTVMRDAALVSMSRARTRPRALIDGVLYFDAVSWMSISPKVVGAYDIAADRPLFIHHMGPVPSGLSIAPEANLIAVSHRAAEKDRPETDIPVPYTSAHDRHAILVLNGAGGVHTYTPVGPKTVEAAVVSGGISSLDLRLMPPDDSAEEGEYRVLAIKQRMSDLYEGPTTAAIYSLSDSLAGEELFRFEGDSNTMAGASVYADGGEARVVLVFDYSGRVVVLDKTLEPVVERVLPGDFHDAALHGIGDYNGDGAPEYIVSDYNKVYILDNNLETRYVSGFDNAVENVAAAPGPEGEVRLAVLAHGVEFLTVGEQAVAGLTLRSIPPGATFFVDDEPVDPLDLPTLRGLAPGTHVVRAVYPDGAVGLEDWVASVDVEGGRHGEVTARFPASPPTPPSAADTPAPTPLAYEDFNLTREVPAPFSDFLLYVDEFLATPGQELLFYHTASGDTRVFDRTGNVRASFGLVDRRSTAVVGARMGPSDLDGDGFSDLSLYAVGPGFTGVSADGRPVLSKRLFYGNDRLIRPPQSFWFDKRLFIPASTGYLQGPDAVFALDPLSHAIDYAYRLGAFSGAAVVHKGLAYFPMYTFNNGNSVTYPDGSVATDGAFYINVMAPGGEHHPSSHEPESIGSQGSLRLFHFDYDGDGESELHYSLGHDPTYYQGVSSIFRITEDGGSELVWTGLEDALITAGSFLMPDGEYLAVMSGRDNRVDILGLGYEVVGTWEMGGASWYFDLDQDGTIEKMYVEDGAVVFATLDGTAVSVLRSNDRTYTSALLRDLDGDGVSEVVAWDGQQVDIWSAPPR